MDVIPYHDKITKNFSYRQGGSDREEFAGFGVDNVAGHADGGGHEGMVADKVDGFAYGRLHVVEAMQPAVEVYAAMAHQGNVLFGDAAILHQMKHFSGVHSLHPAAGMPYHHDFLHAEFINGDEQRAHGGIEGIGDDAPGVFDDFDIAVAQTQGGGEQLHEARVHAGDDSYLLVWILGGKEFLVAT